MWAAFDEPRFFNVSDVGMWECQIRLRPFGRLCSLPFLHTPSSPDPAAPYIQIAVLSGQIRWQLRLLLPDQSAFNQSLHRK